MSRRQGRSGGGVTDALSLILAAAAVAAAAFSWFYEPARRFLPIVFVLAAIVNALYAADCLTPDEQHRVSKGAAAAAVGIAVVMAGLAVVTGLISWRG